MSSGQLTWLTPYEVAWKAVYPEGIVPYKQLARYLAPIQKATPVERIVKELDAFLRKTPNQFVSVAKFAATFGSWATPEPHKAKPYQWRSVDECDRAAGIEVPE